MIKLISENNFSSQIYEKEGNLIFALLDGGQKDQKEEEEK
jgi:hypothetical protein